MLTSERHSLFGENETGSEPRSTVRTQEGTVWVVPGNQVLDPVIVSARSTAAVLSDRVATRLHTAGKLTETLYRTSATSS